MFCVYKVDSPACHDRDRDSSGSTEQFVNELYDSVMSVMSTQLNSSPAMLPATAAE